MRRLVAWRQAVVLLVLGAVGWLAMVVLVTTDRQGDLASPPITLPPAPTATPRPTPVPLLEQATAVTMAIQHARAGFPGVRLVGAPSEIRGRRLPLIEADRLATGGSLAPAPPNDPVVLQRPTWLIVLRGQFVPSAVPPEGGMSARDLDGGQLVVMFDASFAIEWAVAFHPATRPLRVDTLPRLELPTDPAPVVPTRPPASARLSTSTNQFWPTEAPGGPTPGQSAHDPILGVPHP